MGTRRAACGAAAVLLGLAVVAGCANGRGPASAAPTPVAQPVAAPTVPAPVGRVELIGESASFELAAATERAFDGAQAEWLAEDPTQGQLPGHADGKDTLVMPITRGQVDLAAVPPVGRAETAGHAQVVRAGTRLAFDDLVVDLDAHRVDATLDGRPITVLDLDTSRAHGSLEPGLPPEIVDLSGRFSADARREIHDRLGLDLTDETALVDIELRLRPAS